MSESVRSPIWELFAKQAAFIAALLFLFFFGLATYTYSPNDAGWFLFRVMALPFKTPWGRLGATIADLTSGFFRFFILFFASIVFLGCYYYMA